MNKYSEYYKARDEIKQILKMDMIGPVIYDEVLAEYPLQYYPMGKLYPQDSETDILDIARAPVLESESDNYDATLSLSNTRNPSSMGITVTLNNGVRSIKISAYYAKYNLIDFEIPKENKIGTSRMSNKDEKQRQLWKRKGMEYSEIISLDEKAYPIYRNIDEGLELHIYTHKIFTNGERVITATLLNTNLAEKDITDINKLAYLQPEIIIEAANIKSSCIFTEVRRQIDISKDQELLELELLYKETECYAQGHGCSVMWDYDSENKPIRVYSNFLPEFNLKQMKAAEFDGLRIFEMQYLTENDGAKVIEELKSFLDMYAKWIFNNTQQATFFKGDLKNSAENNLLKCNDTLNRIKHTVDLLEASFIIDGSDWKAFRLANKAMLSQRIQTLKRANKKVVKSDIKWYPFQLAFILQEISSIIDPTNIDRKLVDLLWFPTGGGKTEAYLGIAAFTIFLRRLKHGEKGSGVAVIMRYTLRLLTIQQFERASMLICACEIIRKRESLSGGEIAIGLWVGGGLTPNTLDKAQLSILKQKNGAIMNSEESDPCQIRICPWCGSEININNYNVDMKNKKMNINCSNNQCDFHNSLPLHIIDDAIYEHLPSFIVATVDKFAQLPFNDKPAALFGITSDRLSPDLIIQDELHLISGPLGTMTGIYEAAISKLCERNGIPAKVIASTATIRNAESQIKGLYGRKYSQFPPQGLSINDSFFAVASPDSDKPARLYIGCMGVGTTATTTLIRVYAALLFASRYLIDKGYDDKVIDNFWTLTGYFNSLRELGGASTQVIDDVQSRYKYLVDTKFNHLLPKFSGSESYDNLIELTSRMGNSQISEIIQKGLKKEYYKEDHFDVYDFVLASNMISVGVDVGRLGTMVVAGQPKTNSEYIQATSRVGRENPGLVISVLNPSRSRDRSHYEQFIRYHSALYKYVEATSLTPFSDRARDRGLHALYIMLCRYLIEDLRSNQKANNFRSNISEVIEIGGIIFDYVATVDPSELEAVKREIEEIGGQWEDRASDLLYYSKIGSNSLLKPDTDIGDRFRTMNSMRNVDGQSGIYLLGG